MADKDRDWLVNNCLNHKPIMNPREEVADFVSDSSLAILFKQLLATRLSFTTALQNHYVHIAKYALNLLGTLHNQLFLLECRNVYKGAVDHFLAHMNNLICKCDCRTESLRTFSSSFCSELDDWLYEMLKLNDLEVIRERHCRHDDDSNNMNVLVRNNETILEVQEELMTTVCKFKGNYVSAFFQMFIFTNKVRREYPDETITALLIDLNPVRVANKKDRLTANDVVIAEKMQLKFGIARRSLETVVECKGSAVIAAASSFNYPLAFSNLIDLRGLVDKLQNVKSALQIDCAEILLTAENALLQTVLADCAPPPASWIDAKDRPSINDICAFHERLTRVINFSEQLQREKLEGRVPFVRNWITDITSQLASVYSISNSLVDTISNNFARSYNDALVSPISADPFAFVKERLDFLFEIRKMTALAVQTETVYLSLLERVRKNIKDLAEFITNYWSKDGVDVPSVVAIKGRLKLLEQSRGLANTQDDIYHDELEVILANWQSLVDGYLRNINCVEVFDMVAAVADVHIAAVRQFIEPYQLSIRILDFLGNQNMSLNRCSANEDASLSILTLNFVAESKIGDICRQLHARIRFLFHQGSLAARDALQLSCLTARLVPAQCKIIIDALIFVETCAPYNRTDYFCADWLGMLGQASSEFHVHVLEVVEILEREMDFEDGPRPKTATIQRIITILSYLCSFEISESRFPFLQEGRIGWHKVVNEQILGLLLNLKVKLKTKQPSEFQPYCEFIKVLTPFDTVLTARAELQQQQQETFASLLDTINSIMLGLEEVNKNVCNGNYSEAIAICDQMDAIKHKDLEEILFQAFNSTTTKLQSINLGALDSSRFEHWNRIKDLLRGIKLFAPKYLSAEATKICMDKLTKLIESEQLCCAGNVNILKKMVNDFEFVELELALKIFRELALHTAGICEIPELEGICKAIQVTDINDLLQFELAKQIKMFASIPRDLDFGPKNYVIIKLFQQLSTAIDKHIDNNAYMCTLQTICDLIVQQVYVWLAIPIVSDSTPAAVSESYGVNKYTLQEAIKLAAILSKAGSIFAPIVCNKFADKLEQFKKDIAVATDNDLIGIEDSESLSISFTKLMKNQSPRSLTTFLKKVDGTASLLSCELAAKPSDGVSNICSYWNCTTEYIARIPTLIDKTMVQRALDSVAQSQNVLKDVIVKSIGVSLSSITADLNAERNNSWDVSLAVISAMLNCKSDGTSSSELFYKQVVDIEVEARCTTLIRKLCDLFKEWCSTVTNGVTAISSVLSHAGGAACAIQTDYDSLEILLTEMNKSLELMKKNNSLLLTLKTCSAGAPELAVLISECQSYDYLRSNLISNAKQWRCEIEVKDTKYTTTRQSTDRKKYYGIINTGYTIFNLMQRIGESLTVKISYAEDPVKRFENIIRNFALKANNELKTMPGVKKNHEDFNMFYDNIKSISECLHNFRISDMALQQLIALDGNFSDMVTVVVNSARMSDWVNWKEKVPQLTQHLLTLKQLSFEITGGSEKINCLIDGILDSYSKASDKDCLYRFGLEISSSSSEFGSLLISEHALLVNVKITGMNLKTAGITSYSILGIQDPSGDTRPKEPLLKVKQSDPTNFSKLSELYEMFGQEYFEGLVKPRIWPNKDLKEIVRDASSLAIEPDIPYPLRILGLMARVFAVWTLSHSYATKQKATSAANLLTPHATQVISIMRLFRLDASDEYRENTSKAIEEADKVKASTPFWKRMKFFGGTTVAFNLLNLDNHMVEIGTGEGKSITLAVTSIIMALMGYKVDCACYSEHLSKRDFVAFLPLFTMFEVQDYISYGTFDSLCKDFLNENCDIREAVVSMISGDCSVMASDTAAAPGPAASVAVKPKEPRLRALLIDEVDVFISEDFYGKSYNPSAKLTGPAIKALIYYIWSIRSDDNALKQVTKCDLFNACLIQYKGWESLILECVRKLLVDLKTRDHDYFTDTENHRIGYKKQDSISYKGVFGYKTMFAYFEKFERSFPACIEDQVALYINCGSFSYGEVPKLYKFVVGVTGTLDTLINEEKQMLKDVYGVKQYTFIPSMYGGSKRTFQTDGALPMIKIEEDAYYYSTIVNEIKEYAVDKRRAVLVFFNTTKALNEFRKSQAFLPYFTDAAVITEEVNDLDREANVKKAITRNQVTLLTREFGRGTDFICNSEALNNDGGLHVIQTYVSGDMGEEIQIKGRTARQGNKGSFSMVLRDTDLEPLGITLEDVEQMKVSGTRGSTIKERRNAKYLEKFNARSLDMTAIKTEHDKSQQFVADVGAKQMPAVLSFLLEKNRCMLCEQGAVSRTIVLMDATGSMGSVLKTSKEAVTFMFERVCKILNDNKVPNSFELQFVAYRNYSSGDAGLLESSPWVSDPKELMGFISTVEAKGGQINEAMEIGLWHVNQELQKGIVSQVILIGDASPNTKTEVTTKRGTKDWSTTPFAVPTFYKDELELLKTALIPVHAFYVDDKSKTAASIAKLAKTRTSFEWIANHTNGLCNRLVVDSNEGAEMLAGLFASRVLEDVGTKLFDAARGAALKQVYAAEFSFTE